MKRVLATSVLLVILIVGWFLWRSRFEKEKFEQFHYDKSETELILSNPLNASINFSKKV